LLLAACSRANSNTPTQATPTQAAPTQAAPTQATPTQAALRRWDEPAALVAALRLRPGDTVLALGAGELGWDLALAVGADGTVVGVEADEARAALLESGARQRDLPQLLAIATDPDLNPAGPGLDP